MLVMVLGIVNAEDIQARDPMSHTVHEKQKLINRVRRLRGQAEGLERMLEEEKGCGEVMHAIAGMRGAINGLMGEVIEDHILMHLADAKLTQAERDEGAAELIDVLRTYLK
jgi:FrmR/RcnR family transcriptional regulator, repressor of rcnA expression